MVELGKRDIWGQRRVAQVRRWMAAFCQKVFIFPPRQLN